MIASHSSTGASSSIVRARCLAALLTRMSTPPNRSTAFHRVRGTPSDVGEIADRRRRSPAAGALIRRHRR